MTPEERADALARSSICAHGESQEYWPCRVCLIDAFRAAENEALERAASAIDEKIAACSYGVVDCDLCQARAQVARLIRSLKHPEGK